MLKLYDATTQEEQEKLKNMLNANGKSFSEEKLRSLVKMLEKAENSLSSKLSDNIQ